MSRAGHISDVPILRTKLHRPPVVSDVVVRKHLLDKLDTGIELPLTVVLAPAGYGKSTLISHWLETSKVPNVWLSLDETQSEPRVFLEYLVAAVRDLHPDACHEVQALLGAGELPSPSVVAALLTNDLDGLGDRFVLALDDYHQITNVVIHEIVDFLASQALRSVHFVLISRRDPLLSLARYRARGQMNEFRTPDLRFSAAETAEFLGRTVGGELPRSDLERLHRVTEGWPVAVRLAAGALEQRERVGELLESAPDDAAGAQEFLLAEILRHQPEVTVEWLHKTSIVDRICAGLVDAICAPNQSLVDGKLTGRKFLERLERMGLPTMRLDGRGEWRRYHHLVRELLKRGLESDADAEGIAELHRRAAEWFEREGFFEDALSHRFAADEPREAAALVLRLRNALLRDEQWYRLERWLSWLPRELVGESLELLLLKAWSLEHRARYLDFVRLVERAESLLETVDDEQRRDRLAAEIEAMQAGIAYQEKNFPLAVERSRRACGRISEDSEFVWAYATKVLAMSLQMVGDSRGGYSTIDGGVEGGLGVSDTTRGHLLMTRCFLHWIAADRVGLERTGRAILNSPWARELSETIAMAQYFVGAALYHSNSLQEAASLLEPVATDPASPNIVNQLRSVYALAAIHAAEGRGARARNLLDAATERLHQIGNTTFLPEVRAFRAELDLREGHLAEALRWAEGVEPAFASANYSFFLPELTAIRAWIADGSPAAVGRAVESVEGQLRLLESIHSTRFLIEALALRALCRAAVGDREAARADLDRSLELAQPGGYIRLFVDLGPGIAPILHAVKAGQGKTRYAAEILSAFPEPSTDQPLIEPLTARELEVLELVAERLGNREIGERLHIAPGTVKRHTHSIYGKLGVHDRWSAVAKARGLGILPA